MRRCACPSILILSVLLALPRAARADQAKSAQAFIESIGVCTHWANGDTPYVTAYSEVKRRLVESGIRHVRDGFNHRIGDLAQSGVKTCVEADTDSGAPEQIRDKIKALNAGGQAVDAVEGPNEPDLLWIKLRKAYRGVGYKTDAADEEQQKSIAEGVVAFQKDLYTALKADLATAGITVIGPALGKSYEVSGARANPLNDNSLAGAVDLGNFHPYPYGGNSAAAQFAYDGLDKYYASGNVPSCNLDEFPTAFTVFAPPFGSRPMAATESGYSTDTNGASESAQAKYLPRLFCEYYRKGIQRTYLNELIDEFADPGNRQANFGLLHHDTTPKPAYVALQSLIRLLADRSAPQGFRPGKLDFSMDFIPPSDFKRVQYVHHLLLQRSDGDYYLLLWHEISDEDASKSPHKQLSPPAMPTQITFTAPVRRATIYSYDGDWNLQPKIVTFANNTLSLDVPDTVTIVRLAPAGARTQD